MANLINEAEIRNTWSPIIEEATGINEASKLAWMSEYCHNHKLYEDASVMTLGTAGNIFGMGATKFPVGTAQGDAGAAGSGDKAPTLLPLAMQAAGNALGADIAAAGGVNGDYEFIGTSRIDGKFIYKVGTLDSANASVAEDLEAFGATAGSVELVKALEDHIPGFSGAADTTGRPMAREVGEQTPDKVMGLSLFSKSVSAETFQVAAAVTREQVQDLKQFGVDAVAQVEAVLTNELTQSINNHILTKMRSLAGSGIGDVAYNAQLGGGETIADRQRAILTNILAAANLIAQRGRRGAGNFAVVGGGIASALQSIAGFVA